jgi:hypothetical protein
MDKLNFVMVRKTTEEFIGWETESALEEGR